MVTSMQVVIPLAGGLAFAESGIGLGMVVPGEAGVVLLAASVDAPGWRAAVFVSVAIGACLGDHVGYWLGRTQGARLGRSRLVARAGERHWARAVRSLERRGAAAVFLTRLVPVVRTLAPAAAGVAGLAYGRFLAASLAGSALWSGVYVGGGVVVAGAVAQATPGFVAAAAVAAAGLVVAYLLRRGAQREGPDMGRPAGSVPRHLVERTTSRPPAGRVTVGDSPPHSSRHRRMAQRVSG